MCFYILITDMKSEEIMDCISFTKFHLCLWMAFMISFRLLTESDKMALHNGDDMF